jgi:basic amino acid/polyamine antiporter, APA family
MCAAPPSSSTERAGRAPAPPAATGAAVLRTIGQVGLTAIVLNQIIGSGVFALPGTVAGRLGWYALIAHALAALIALAIMLSFGEVASRFDRAGGPYLYAQTAFGRFVGLQMGWMALFVRLLSAAVQVNLLTTYLAEFWAPAGRPVGAAAVGALLLGVLAAINMRGARPGTRLTIVFAAVKISALLLFAGVGLAWMAGGHGIEPVPATALTPQGWLGVLLLLMFAYGGFESAVIPMGEARDPRRDAPRALVGGLLAVFVVYLLVQIVVLGTLADPGGSSRPLAASAEVLFGRAGAAAMTIVAMTSVYGWGSAAMLAVPRLTLAMAERGDLPRLFAWIHPRWRTPWVSIGFFAVAVFVLSQQGGLLQNISLSTVSRLLTYSLVCAALPVFRWREGTPDAVEPARFRAPFGSVVATIGVVASLVLVTQMTGKESLWLAAVSALALLHWTIVRDRR